MKRRITASEASRSVAPADPVEVAIGAVAWQRTGLLQRLVKVDRSVHVKDWSISEEQQSRRAA